MPNIFPHIRHLRRLSSPQPLLSRLLHSQSPTPLFSVPDLPRISSTDHLTSLRYFSVHSPTNGSENEGDLFDASSSSSEWLGLGFSGGSEAAEGVVGGGEWYEPLVRTVVAGLDGYHDLTGLPWWFIIASSTLALRVSLLPLLYLQLKKMERFSELFPKLPPPFPPLLSGKSYIKQYLHFRKEKQAIGCPSALWGLATISVQVPCFLLWMTSIRKMSLNHHPGFDCGGMLWFQDLTETPSGVLGLIFPVVIAGLHYTNVQVSFRMAIDGKATGLLGILAKYYKLYLDILTLPICLIGFCMPQGSLVYWLTNSSVTLVQQLCLHHPPIREKLGLRDLKAKKSEEYQISDAGEITFSGREMKRGFSVQNLSPDQLVPLSVQYLAKRDLDRAIPLLRLALEKDPEYVRALVLLGQALMQQSNLAEATGCLERAISKLTNVGLPSREEDVDILILASTWAGTLLVRQGKILAGLEHLQRITKIKEPEDPRGKAHYFDGLFMLASTLFTEGQKHEAEKLLRRAVAYDYDTYNTYLQQCLEDSDSQQCLEDSDSVVEKKP